MVTRLCLVRHAETDWNRQGRLQGRTDIALNATGLASSRAVGARLAAHEWDGIVSSPLRRAAQTAEVLQDVADIPFCGTEPLLVERCYGAAEGLTSRERGRRFPDGIVPGLEPRAGAAARGLAALAALRVQRSGARLLVVVT
jgi:broad specificity phosphatase PhoE